MTAKKPTTSDRKVIDIHTPGQTKPSATSRPIIVKNKTLSQDPMMAEDKGNETPAKSDTAAKVVTHSGRTIMPLPKSGDKTEAASDESNPTKTAPTASELVGRLESKQKAAKQTSESAPKAVAGDEADPEKQTDKSEPEEASSSEPTQAETSTGATAETTAGNDDSSDEDNSDEEDESTPAKAKKDAEAEEEAAAKRQAELDELAESGKYFVTINAVRRRHDLYWLTFLLLIVLALVAVDLLFDAGYLKVNGFTPPTDFFSN